MQNIFDTGYKQLVLPSIPGGHVDISHFIPVVVPGEAVGFRTREEGSERVRHCRRSHSTARGGGADCKPQGCSHSLKLWPFSRQVDRGAALAGEQSLSFRLQLARGRVPSSFSSGPRGEHRVHSFAAGVGGHRQVSTVLDAMDYNKHRVGAG